MISIRINKRAKNIYKKLFRDPYFDQIFYSYRKVVLHLKEYDGRSKMFLKLKDYLKLALKIFIKKLLIMVYRCPSIT